MKNIIELDQVGMVYETGSGPVEALRDINLAVGEGEFISLVGPSGCGKSTLLRVVAGLRPMTSGSVVVGGVPVTKPIPKVGMVFQAAVLLKWRSILDNVLLPAELAGLNARDYRTRAHELLELVGLSDFSGKRPNELSGGMQQRVALCRALLLDPPLLLLNCCASGVRPVVRKVARPSCLSPTQFPKRFFFPTASSSCRPGQDALPRFWISIFHAPGLWKRGPAPSSENIRWISMTF